MRRKVLGTSVDYRDIVNFNVKLIVSYCTTTNEKVKKEAIFSVATTDRQTAESIAIEKAKRQLEEFPYIVKNSVTIESKRRTKKREV